MKSVLITGCSSGLGRGIMDEFLQRGWRVFCTMRNAHERRYILAEALAKYPNQLTLLDLEVTDFQQRNTVVQTIEQSGGLDCLVNNAGFGLLGALENLSEEQISYQMEVNFLAPVFLTRALLPLLRQTKGKVIFISSVCGYIGFPLMSIYAASKYALEGFAESLYYELQSHGVDVSLIEVGLSKTNFTKNVIWGIDEKEAYKKQTENYRVFQAELSSKAKNNVSLVALKVVDISEQSYHQLRIRVGEEAILTNLFQRLFPEKIWIWALKVFYQRKLFNNQNN